LVKTPEQSIMPTHLPSLSRLLLLLFIIAGSLTGCGQKGDLYLPDDASQQEEENRD
jgi:predicted small lipoprotein YifL